ncbi:MAG: hypothetical protein Q8761_03230, partial [Sweet potato little leaf phytoplasma]|nr:hypothetical protein [Sweet potato little leaf phytoplasma]
PESFHLLLVPGAPRCPDSTQIVFESLNTLRQEKIFNPFFITEGRISKLLPELYILLLSCCLILLLADLSIKGGVASTTPCAGFFCLVDHIFSPLK